MVPSAALHRIDFACLDGRLQLNVLNRHGFGSLLARRWLCAWRTQIAPNLIWRNKSANEAKSDE
jgi:hypothetical protein